MKFTNFGKKLLAFIAVLTFGLVLVSCGGGNDNGGDNNGGDNNQNQNDPNAELKAQHQANVQAVLDSIFFDETLLAEVKGNLVLVQQNGKYPDVKIEWTSSETDLIANDGSVTRPALDDPRAVDGLVEVTLTVKASQGEAQATKSFKAYVLGEKKTNVATIKDIKASFYAIMQENGVVFNGKTQDYTINATITAEVVIVLGTKGFFVSDGTGLMYVYSSNPTCKVGDVVTVTAGVYAYYGACQFGSSVSYEAAASQDFADLTFEKTTIDAYTAELDSARDNAGLIADLNKMAKYSGYGVELYAKVGKGNQGTNDTYYLEDPYTTEKVAIYYYTTADYEAQFDALVGKYVNIKVFTYDCYSTNSMYRVLYSGQAITEAAAPELSDAQKVAAALSSCTLAATLTEDVTLPVVEGVVWALKEASNYAVIENGVLKVTRPENGAGNATVVLVATATFGNETDSKEIEVEVAELEKQVAAGEELVAYEFGTDKAMPAGLTYITNNASYPDPSFYADGGLKMNYVNMGVQTSTFEAQSEVVVVINVRALNDNTKTAGDADAFTVYGLDANGNVVATASLANVVAGDNAVTLTGAGIVSVKVVMTDYPAGNKSACANVSLGAVKVCKPE